MDICILASNIICIIATTYYSSSTTLVKYSFYSTRVVPICIIGKDGAWSYNMSQYQNDPENLHKKIFLASFLSSLRHCRAYFTCY